MPVYFITGRLGSGKSLVGVKRAQEYLQSGRPVATNMDLNLEHLVDVTCKDTRLVRVPDKPKAADLVALGRAYEGDYDESKFGMLLLDELGSWLNSRGWNDKARQPFIEYLIHARKLGWDIYFLVQDIGMVDVQVRTALCEYLVTCKRTDRITIPGTGIKAPKVHVASVYYGDTASKALKEETWMYRGKELYKAYDTTQAFSPFYSDGNYSVLPPGYWVEPEPEKEKGNMNFRNFLAVAVLSLVGYGVYYAASMLKGGGMGIFSGTSIDVVEEVEPGKKTVVDQVVQKVHALVGYTYNGYIAAGNKVTLLMESGDRRIKLHADAEMLEGMGYEVIDYSQGALVTMWRGSPEIFTSAE